MENPILLTKDIAIKTWSSREGKGTDGVLMQIELKDDSVWLLQAGDAGTGERVRVDTADELQAAYKKFTGKKIEIVW